MLFEWDEDKCLKNIVKHGIDFLTACALFDGRLVYTFPSPRGGEERLVTVGIIEDRLVTVVWTWRGHNVRMISVRRSRDKEKRAYRQLFGG